MKIRNLIMGLPVVLGIACSPAITSHTNEVYPGEPGKRQFWNKHAGRFIFPPSFDMPNVSGASDYKFTIKTADGPSLEFKADKPWSSLSPIWDKVPEGYTVLTIEGIDSQGAVVGKSGERAFYRSPDFAGYSVTPKVSYLDAGRRGLKALYDAAHVQYWLKNGKPDPTYQRYCYPNKIIGGLMRGMTAFSKIAITPAERDAALKIARLSADHLIAESYPASSPYAFIPPTYSGKYVNKPVGLANEPIEKQWFMVPSAVDPALGYLDLYDVTQDAKYLDAAKAIANTLVKRQESDGTWPYMFSMITETPAVAQRLIPTWVILLFDRMENQYGIKDYKNSRKQAWEWVKKNPLLTYQWDGQFEDIKPRPAYENLAREQACDVSMLLMDEVKTNPKALAQAEELLRFSEDQFVQWAPVKDPVGWHKANPNRRNNAAKWMPPSVLEQYACYDPVARSSAILINAYLKAYDVTGKDIYMAKATAVANALLEGQAWSDGVHNTNGEIPTWVMKSKPINWLNNSYYSAEAVLNISKYKEY